MLLTKKIFLSILVVLITLSCSSDDNAPETDDSALVIGTYSLAAVNVNPAQDQNDDGTASTNLLDEMVCITGTLTVNTDRSWRLNVVRINVSSITGGQFFFSCGDPDNSSGTWTFNNNQLSLNGSFEPTIYLLNETTLTRQIGENLPGFQSVVFTKN